MIGYSTKLWKEVDKSRKKLNLIFPDGGKSEEYDLIREKNIQYTAIDLGGKRRKIIKRITFWEYRKDPKYVLTLETIIDNLGQDIFINLLYYVNDNTLRIIYLSPGKNHLVAEGTHMFNKIESDVLEDFLNNKTPEDIIVEGKLEKMNPDGKRTPLWIYNQ